MRSYAYTAPLAPEGLSCATGSGADQSADGGDGALYSSAATFPLDRQRVARHVACQGRRMLLPTACILAALFSVAVGLVAIARKVALGLNASPAKASAAVALGVAAVAALALGLADYGFFAHFESVPPRIALFALTVTVASQLALGRVRAIAVLPVTGLVALQSFRVVVEVGLHALGEAGHVPPVMTWSGRNFDVLVGFSAPLVAWASHRFGAKARALVLAWNVAGLALLVNVVVLAMTSVPGPTHLQDGVSLTIVAHVPFILLPAVLVPVALSSHIAIFRALLGRRDVSRGCP